MKNKDYNIKQVLFIVLNDKQQIIPVQIVEKLVREKLDGNETIYKVRDPKGEKVYELNKLSGEIYSEPTKLKQILKTKIFESIDKMVDNAMKVAKIRYGYEPEKENRQETISEKEEYSLSESYNEEDMLKENSSTLRVLSKKELDSQTIEIVDENGKPQKVKVRSVTGFSGAD